jgi:hypothetical protein
VLPRSFSGPDAFYGPDGHLSPAFHVHMDLQKEFAEDLRKLRYFGARPAHPTQSRSILEVEEAIDSIDL